jgi:anti-sigma B factor antagonist
MTTAGHKPLEMTVTQQGGAFVISLTGSVSISDADRLREQLEQLAADCVPVIVLDLGRMDFICSLGLGAIITGHLKCRHHQGQIRLVNPSTQVRTLLETTRLTKLFPIFESVEKALPES